MVCLGVWSQADSKAVFSSGLPRPTRNRTYLLGWDQDPSLQGQIRDKNLEKIFVSGRGPKTWKD